jgi:hypothetical protein
MYENKEIDALQPGAELDALIAEKVMFLNLPSPHDRETELPKPYSTKIYAAWEVVEAIKLRLYEGFCSVYVMRTAAGNSDYRYECIIAERIYDESGWAKPDKYSVLGSGPDAPLAICRAALKAEEQAKLLRAATGQTGKD